MASNLKSKHPTEKRRENKKIFSILGAAGRVGGGVGEGFWEELESPYSVFFFLIYIIICFYMCCKTQHPLLPNPTHQ